MVKVIKESDQPFELVFCIQQHKDHDVLHEHEHKDHFHQMKNYNESNQLVLQFQNIELLVTHLQNPSFQMLVFDHFSSIDPIIIKIQQQKWHINDYNFNNKNKIK